MQASARGARLVQIASVYMLIGLGMGLFMGMSQDHRLATVHSHLALLGWVTMALAGLIYMVAPACGRGALAASHFWLHNLGLPLMIASLGLYAYGRESAEPLIGVGSTIVFLSLSLFAASVIRNLPARPWEAGHMSSRGAER